eukprot:TRINITY_DN33706_c0_g1_i2.p1 TRINITY_DN33706_c0_g1~~TRINITY_DN33706_c0_g1_i2.p1  ORF type:complete len:235 (-),score=42.14 TRINITY_DN33706_c0_g1_i2:100-804(-)
MPGPMAGPGNRDLQVIASSREQHSQDEQQPLLERAAALLSDRVSGLTLVSAIGVAVLLSILVASLVVHLGSGSRKLCLSAAEVQELVNQYMHTTSSTTATQTTTSTTTSASSTTVTATTTSTTRTTVVPRSINQAGRCQETTGCEEGTCCAFTQATTESICHPATFNAEKKAWTIESSPPYVDSVALDGSLADLASEGFLTTGGNVDLTALEEEMYGPYQCHEEGWVESRRLQR